MNQNNSNKEMEKVGIATPTGKYEKPRGLWAKLVNFFAKGEEKMLPESIIEERLNPQKEKSKLNMSDDKIEGYEDIVARIYRTFLKVDASNEKITEIDNKNNDEILTAPNPFYSLKEHSYSPTDMFGHLCEIIKEDMELNPSDEKSDNIDYGKRSRIIQALKENNKEDIVRAIYLLIDDWCKESNARNENIGLKHDDRRITIEALKENLETISDFFSTFRITMEDLGENIENPVVVKVWKTLDKNGNFVTHKIKERICYLFEEDVREKVVYTYQDILLAALYLNNREMFDVILNKMKKTDEIESVGCGYLNLIASLTGYKEAQKALDKRLKEVNIYEEFRRIYEIENNPRSATAYLRKELGAPDYDYLIGDEEKEKSSRVIS